MFGPLEGPSLHVDRAEKATSPDHGDYDRGVVSIDALVGGLILGAILSSHE